MRLDAVAREGQRLDRFLVGAFVGRFDVLARDGEPDYREVCLVELQRVFRERGVAVGAHTRDDGLHRVVDLS